MVMSEVVETNVTVENIQLEADIDIVNRVLLEGDNLFIHVEPDSFGYSRGACKVDLRTGEVHVGDLQAPEYPLLKALTTGYELSYKVKEGMFVQVTLPYTRDKYPLLFEIERMLKEPLEIGEVIKAFNDGNESIIFGFHETNKTELAEFSRVYNAVLESSPTQKPFLESFYRAHLKENIDFIAIVGNPEYPQRRREYSRHNILKDEDFARIYGRHYETLKQAFGEPAKLE